MSLALEVSNRAETYKLNLDPKTTFGELKTMMYNYTNILPEKQKYMGWNRFEDTALVSECAKKKGNKVTLMGMQSKTKNPNMIANVQGGYEFTTATNLKEALAEILEDRSSVDTEALNSWFKVMKAQENKDKSFVNEPGLLSLILISAIVAPKLCSQAVHMLINANPNTAAECIPELIELMGSVTESASIRNCLSALNNVAVKRAKRFTQEHVNKLVKISKKFADLSVQFMMMFNRLAMGNPAPFGSAESIEYFIEVMAGDGKDTHIGALILSYVAKETHPVLLEKKLDEMYQIVLTASNDILKYSHGVMLFAAVGSSPNFTVAQKQAVIQFIVSNILQDPDLPNKYTGIIIVQILAIAKGNRAVLDPFKAVLIQYGASTSYGSAIADFVNGNTSSPQVQKLIQELEQQMAKVSEKVEQLNSVVSENTQNIQNLNNRVDEVETRTEEQANKLDDLTEQVEDTKQQMEDLTEVVSDHSEQIAAVQETVKDHEAKMEKVMQVVIDMDYLKNYVDQNIESMKDFVGKIVKKLPVPVRFSADGKILRTLKLHFACCKMDQGCLYNMTNTFTTQTHDWNKWLKLGISGVNLATKIYNKDVMASLSEIKNAYDIFQSTEDSDFATYMQEPFLTSEEQDKLINQLRDAKFFEAFAYDAQTGGWACSSCVSKACRKATLQRQEQARKEKAAKLKAQASNNNNGGGGWTSASPSSTSASQGKDTKFLSFKESTNTIYQAAANGEVRRVLDLFKFGIDVNAPDSSGQTPLHYAVRNDQIAVIEVLLDRGANINAVDPDGYCAIDCGKDETRELILEKLSFPAMFVPDSTFDACQLCSTTFTQIRRRHHCRHCGKLVCKDCSSYKVVLPCFGFASPVRVCIYCSVVIERVKKQTLPPSAQLQKQMEEQQAQGKTKQGVNNAVSSGKVAAKLIADKIL